ncbi:hypothetical protein M2322_000618 [Rhodoblastus acidophilus]|nr:hypothetical protein [Rhodoblastus acidophilus]
MNRGFQIVGPPLFIGVAQGAGALLIVGAARRHEVREGEPLVRRQPLRHDRFRHRVDSVARLRTQRGPQIAFGLVRIQRPEQGAFFQSALEELVENAADLVGDAGDGRGQGGVGLRGRQNVAAGLIEQRIPAGVFEHAETGGHIRLERRDMKKALAEGVNRQHFQAAGRFQRPREQDARALQLVRPLRSRLSRRGDGLGQVRIRERRPMGQGAEHALGHIGGGGFGEGQAKNPAGPIAVQEEPNHALRQHMRLARPGVGGDPGRIARVGRPRLVTARFFGDRAFDAHASSDESFDPTTDHSRVRARWSYSLNREANWGNGRAG